MGDDWSSQTVVVMLSLHQNLDQIRRLEPAQVYARGRRAHLSHDCKLGACSRMAVHQAIKDAPSLRFTDSGRNLRGRLVVMLFDIHTLILNELFLSSSPHNPNHADSQANNPADEPPPSDFGHLGDRRCDGPWLRYTTHRVQQENIHDGDLRHPLPARSLPARRVQEVRREWGPHHPSMRR